MSVSPSHRVSTGERLQYREETTGKLKQAIRERGISALRGSAASSSEVMDAAEQHLRM